MRLNLRLMQAFQFLQLFKLDVHHKSDKKYIIPYILSCLTSTKTLHTNPYHSELVDLFTYNIMLIEIYLALVFQILASYKADT